MRSFRYLCIFLLLAVFNVAQAGDRAAELAQSAMALYYAGDYPASAAMYEQAIALDADDPTLHYNAACSHALAGNSEAAFAHLAEAVALGFMSAGHLQGDSDLATLHGDARWNTLLEQVQLLERRAALRWDGAAFRTAYRERLSDDEKVAGLSRVWAEAKFGFVNFDQVPDLDWDARYLEFIPRVRQAQSTLDYYRVLMAFMAALKDGHSNIYPPRELFGQMLSAPGIRTGLFEGRVLVRKVFHPSAESAGLRVGQEIVAVNGMPVHEYASVQVAPYQSASTAHDLDVRVYDYRLLAGDIAESLVLRVRDVDGVERDLSVPRLLPEERYASSPPAFELTWRDGDVVHVRLNSFEQMAAAEAFIERLDELRARAKGIVLDVRENGGGNSDVGFRILTHLLHEPFVAQNWSASQYVGAYRAWGRPQEQNGPHTEMRDAGGEAVFDGPVALLIGPRTYSAAEDFAVAFDASGRGVLIGEASGGSTGQPVFFGLPGGGGGRVCSKRNRYPDGTEFVGIGVQPDIVAGWTAQALRSGADPALDRALEWLRSQR